jgi:23S rRNA pseudouridine1911/1915/1917 synthase
VFLICLLPADGVVTKDVDAPLKIGMKLEYFRPPWKEPMIPDEARIVFLYEDDHVRIPAFARPISVADTGNHIQVCVVNKPSEVPVLPGGQYSDNTVLNMIKHGRRCIGNKSADSLDTSKYLYAPVHRLGRGTSGALLFAKVRPPRFRIDEMTLGLLIVSVL